MTRDPAPLHRCVAVWVLASTALVGLGGWLLPGLAGAAAAAAAPGPHLPFDEALVRLCEATLLACGTWLWVVTAVVSTDAARGRGLRRPGVPTWLRHLLLVACGAALATLAAPAHADPGPGSADRSTSPLRVQGLPLPDRATAAGHVGLLLARQVRDPQHPQPRAASVAVVRPGDTLWSIAAADLPIGADDAAVVRRWQEIYRANRRVIGSDPDLIHPAQRLRLPRR